MSNHVWALCEDGEIVTIEIYPSYISLAVFKTKSEAKSFKQSHGNGYMNVVKMKLKGGRKKCQQRKK